jgi:hypothetical protein
MQIFKEMRRRGQQVHAMSGMRLLKVGPSTAIFDLAMTT